MCIQVNEGEFENKERTKFVVLFFFLLALECISIFLIVSIHVANTRMDEHGRDSDEVLLENMHRRLRES